MGPKRPAYGANGSPRSDGARRDAALAELAARQHGVVARAQLGELGFTRSAISRAEQAGRVHRIHAGVFAVGHLALTQRSRELAAVLACGPGALLSHRSAGRLWALTRTAPARVEVTAPRSRKPKPGIELHRSRSIAADDRAELHGIPVTSVARTLVDLADVLDERRLASAVNEAEVLRLFDLDAIQATLDRRAGGAGRHKLARVLAAYREPPGYSTTRAERLFEELCERHGLPRPQRVTMAGYELDFYWADARLAVEVDGARFHGTRRAFHEDRVRDRRLAALGIQTARVTWRDLQADAETARELRAIRERRLTS